MFSEETRRIKTKMREAKENLEILNISFKEFQVRFFFSYLFILILKNSDSIFRKFMIKKIMNIKCYKMKLFC